MSKKNIFLILLTGAALLTAGYFVIPQFTFAQNLADITYPVAELNNCANEQDCKNYCEAEENLPQCLEFAEKNALMSAEEIDQAKKFVAAGSKGPGGCKSKESCESYCDDINNINECVSFAEQTGIMPPEELEEARKVQKALASGAKLPPGCINKSSCEAACDNPVSEEVATACMDFAVAAGFMNKEDREKAVKALSLFREGKLPFKSMRDMQKCENPTAEILEKCIEAGRLMGFISEKEERLIKITGGRGPGGCIARECEAFCENEANQETCANFMTELLEKNPDLNLDDIIPEEDRARMQDGLKQMREALLQAPTEVKNCIDGKLPGIIAKIEAGNLSPAEMIKNGPKFGSIMPECFKEVFSAGGFPGGPGGFPGGPEGGFPGGPGELPPGSEGVLEECFAQLGFDPNSGATPPAGFQEQIQTCVQDKLGAGGPGGFPFPGQSGEFPGAPGQFPAQGFGPTDHPFDPSQIPPGFDPSQFDPSQFNPSQLPQGFDPSQIPQGIDPSQFGQPGTGNFDPNLDPNSIIQQQIQQQTQDQFQQQFQQQFNQQYQDQYNQQYQQQYQQQLQQQIQGQIPQGFDPSQYPTQYPSGYDPNLVPQTAPQQYYDPSQQPPPPPQSRRFDPPSLLGFIAQILGLR